MSLDVKDPGIVIQVDKTFLIWKKNAPISIFYSNSTLVYFSSFKNFWNNRETR